MLGGQLRLDSNANEEKGPAGTKGKLVASLSSSTLTTLLHCAVTLILPFRIAPSAQDGDTPITGPPTAERRINSLARRSSTNSGGSGGSEIDSLIADMSSSLQGDLASPQSPSSTRQHRSLTSRSTGSRSSNVSAGSLRRSGSLKSSSRFSGSVKIQDSATPLRASKIDPMTEDRSQTPKVDGSRSNASTLPSAPGNEDVKIRDFQAEKQQSEVEQRMEKSSADAEQRMVDPSGSFKVLVVEVRSFSQLQLLLADLFPSAGRAHQLDAHRTATQEGRARGHRRPAWRDGRQSDGEGSLVRHHLDGSQHAHHGRIGGDSQDSAARGKLHFPFLSTAHPCPQRSHPHSRRHGKLARAWTKRSRGCWAW